MKRENANREDGKPEGRPASGRPGSALRRTLRTLGRVGLGVLGLVIVLFILLFLAPVRDRILNAVLPRVSGSLPGTLSVSDAKWYRLNALRFEGVSWESDSVTVLSADTLEVSVRLLPLLSKDIKAKYLVARGLEADIPGIGDLFTSSDSLLPDSIPAGGEEVGKEGFPRGGSLPGFPSVAIDSLAITAPYIALSPESRIEDIVLDAGIDFLRGGPPRLSLSRLALRGAGEEWRVDDLMMAISFGEGILEGRGEGAVSAELPFYLEIEPVGRDEFVIVLAEEPGANPPGDPGIRAAIKLERDGREIVAATYDIDMLTPGTDRLREIPAIAGRIESMPDSRGINLAAKGTVGFDPDLDVSVRLSVQEPDWLDRGVAIARYRQGTLRLDSLLVTLIDLDLSAEGSLSKDSAAGSAEITATGSEGLRLVAPGAGIPDSLELWLRTVVEADLEKRTISVSLSAANADMLASTKADIEQQDGILIRMEPVWVRPLPGAADPRGLTDSAGRPFAEGAKTGTITYAQESGDIRLENVEIVGALGDLKVNGYRSGDGAGSFDLSCLWPEPPLPLIARFGESPDVVEAFSEAWTGDAPYSLEIEAGIQPGEFGNAIEVSGDFTLPGPRSMAPLLPEGARLDGMGPVAGSIEFRSEPVDTLVGFDLMLDLDRTEWMDSSFVRISALGRAISIDSLLLRTNELRLDLKGEYDMEAGTGRGTLALSDSGFVRRFHPSAPEADLVATGSFTGGDHRYAGVSLEASIRGDGYLVPALAGSLSSDRAGTAVYLSCPEGFTYGGLRMDGLNVDYLTSEGDGSPFPADIRLDAVGERLSLSQQVHLDIGDSVVFAVDAMDVSTSKGSLAASHPFKVLLDRTNQAITLEGLELEGTLGRVSANGIAGMDSVNVEALIDLALSPTPPPALAIPDVIWPDSISARINAADKHDLTADILISGFLLDDGEPGSLELDVRTEAGSIGADLVIADRSGELASSTISLPGSLSVYPPSVNLSGGDLRLEAGLDRFPLAVKKSTEGSGEGPDLVARIAGTAQLAGPVSGPGGFADLTVTFPGWPEMTDFRVGLEALLQSESGGEVMEPVRLREMLDRVTRNLGIDRTENLVASARLFRGSESMLDADLSYPISVSLDPFGMTVDSSRVRNVAVRSRQLPLEEMDLLMPVGVGLDGSCSIDLSGRGPGDSLALSGSLQARELDIEIANFAQILLDGNASFAGTARRPSITGNFTVASGVVTMPESKPELHPVEGEAILLDPTTLGLAPIDSARGVAMGSPGFKADYDVSIDIPSSLWLRGEGLEIELRGGLRIIQKDGLPVVTGDLNAQRGTYLFLGRVFELERGIINFYGTEELNPSLDISLVATIESNTIWVKLTGDLVEPRLTLESNPEMPDGDIMSTVLFGKPFNELNDGQGDMLRNRMTDVLVAMGAARIQQEVAGQYGIDLVSIRSGRGDSQENALVVGKYLTPKLLVSYEQGLNEKSTSYIVMEYLLHRHLRVETLYGNDGRSSAGINLQKDY